MKVNTDGILLGAWTQLNQAKHILDIGTGTGLITLMLAQRFAEKNAKFSAVEIDLDAAKQARFNVNQSPWSQQIEVINQDILNWSESPSLVPQKFDLLVSNPPYFSNSLLGPEQKRNQARHNCFLDFNSLAKISYELTSADGEFNLILPTNEATRFIELAQHMGWQLKRLCQVQAVTDGKTIRTLICLTKSPEQDGLTETTSLVIRNKKGHYTPEFQNLCRDFYLKM